MSEISKARERLLHQRGQLDNTQTLPHTTQPRKFTVSSLTQKFDRVQDVSPSASNAFSKNNFDLRPIESPMASRTQWSQMSKSKENAQPMLKTINIKIHEMSRLTSQPSQSQDNWPQRHQSRYFESPPRVAYRRALHKNKPELLVVPLPSRKHHSPFKPRECLKQWAQGIINQARSSGRSFVDDYFPPARTIIFSRNILCQEQNLKFERLSHIYQSNEVVLLQSCQPTNISPGKYTNPYLYSALTIIAQNPERVLALFGAQQFSEQGAYHLCLCKDGVWRYILVDDFMPVKSIAGRKQILSIHNKQADNKVEIWPALIEKAVAKIYGTYIDLFMSKEQGMVDLFKLLTGAPATIYELNKDFRSFLILVDSAIKRGHIVTLQAVIQEEVQTARLRNLTVNQAYRVLDIKKSGLKIRNYAEPQLVTKLAFDECLIFSRLVIYRIQPTYRYTTQKLRHKKKYYSKVSIVVPNTTRAYFDIWQNNIAYYKRYLGSNIEYQPSAFKMWLSRGQEGEWIEAAKQIELQKGEYELSVHLCQGKEYDFTLSYYGQKDVTIQRIKCNEEWQQSCICNKK